MFLTTDGEVWTCGRGEYGLCGNGGTDDQLTPSPLETFEDHIIVDVQVDRWMGFVPLGRIAWQQGAVCLAYCSVQYTSYCIIILPYESGAF